MDSRETISSSQISPKTKRLYLVYIHLNTIENVDIKDFEYDEKEGYFYELHGINGLWHEDSIYSSKKSLIDAQIDYWVKLRAKMSDCGVIHNA